MVTRDEVEGHLKEFIIKLSMYDMITIERKKNRETLAELEILHVKTFYIEELKKLMYLNYSEGPIPDTENSGEYWVFGTSISGREIYIKINYGLPKKPCILISFHFAEREMEFPLR
jgi:hypothetical protein